MGVKKKVGSLREREPTFPFFSSVKRDLCPSAFFSKSKTAAKKGHIFSPRHKKINGPFKVSYQRGEGEGKTTPFADIALTVRS